MAGKASVSGVLEQPENLPPASTPPEYFDDLGEDDDDETVGGFTEADCGRWRDGRLGQQCSLAGTEECDWECPYSR